jgi:hypothetical protein
LAEKSLNNDLEGEFKYRDDAVKYSMNNLSFLNGEYYDFDKFASEIGIASEDLKT